MDSEEFREYGKKTVDYIIDYKENTAKYPVLPLTDAGYLAEALPEHAPEEGESFEQIFEDIDKLIMPGVTHWNHPQFHAYFPSGNAYTNVIADSLNAALGCVGFSWKSNPVGAELETIVLDWLARALHLPEHFMADKSDFVGGGCFQGSASEATLVATFAARARAIRYLRGTNKDVHESVYLPRLVAYASREAHSSVEKACMMALVQLRILETDSKGVLKGETVLKAMKKDIENGFTPCLVTATLGTTGFVAFDDLRGIALAIEETKPKVPIWLHVDGAYGGNSFICPEMRGFMSGLEMADSFMVNPNKLLLGAFDMTCFWVRSVTELKSSLIVNPAYLQNASDHKRQIDYRHYGIPLSRRFRSLKLWFLLRSYGLEGLRKYIRNIITNTKYFEGLIRQDPRFEIINDVHLGLIAFRYKENFSVNEKQANEMTTMLHDLMNASKEIHVVPGRFYEKVYIRVSVNYEKTTTEHIDESWNILLKIADQVKLTKTKALRKRPTQFAFFRSVSKEVLDRQNSHPNLTDGCTPVFVLENDDILDSLRKATMKMNGAKVDEDKFFTNNNNKNLHNNAVTFQE